MDAFTLAAMVEQQQAVVQHVAHPHGAEPAPTARPPTAAVTEGPLTDPFAASAVAGATVGEGPVPLPKPYVRNDVRDRLFGPKSDANHAGAVAGRAAGAAAAPAQGLFEDMSANEPAVSLTAADDPLSLFAAQQQRRPAGGGGGGGKTAGAGAAAGKR